MKRAAFFSAFFLPAVALHSQEHHRPQVAISGYAEVYYCYDLNDPANHNRPPFMYSHHRHNEFNLNLGLLRAAVSDTNYRAALALMAGTYANANMAAEPGVIKNIFEANAGVKLSRRKNTWLDVGIFPSHIGFESATGKDCWTVTRSIMADNTPYFESGAKLSWGSANEKWTAGLLVLNGWQRIQRVAGNSAPSFGTQLVFRNGEKLTLNSSTFVGTDKPDSTRRMRYFHNFYAIARVTERIGLTAGFDAGVEQKAKGSTMYNGWLNPNVIARFRLAEKMGLALRGEYYRDPGGVIISTGTPAGFRTYSYSINFDYSLSPNAMWRIEARSMHSKDKIFMRDGSAVNDDYFFTTVLAVSF